MAKISREQGPSYTETEQGHLEYPRRAVLGEVDKPSAGNSSEPLQKNTLNESDSQTEINQLPARTTESHSQATHVEAVSIVSSTVGDTQTTQPAPSSKKATPRKAARKANVRSTVETDEDDF